MKHYTFKVELRLFEDFHITIRPISPINANEFTSLRFVSSAILRFSCPKRYFSFENYL